MSIHKTRNQFVTFLLVGAACAAVNFGVGVAIRMLSSGGAAYAASVGGGFTLGALLSFVLNRRFTFGVASAPWAPQAVKFALASFVSVALSAAVAEVLLWSFEALAPRRIGAQQLEGLAHVGTIGVMTIFNFLAMKLFALRAPETSRRDGPRPRGSVQRALAPAAPAPPTDLAAGAGSRIPARVDLDTP